MRKLGFYGSDDFGITDMQPIDFERLISTGRIKITEQAVKTPLGLESFIGNHPQPVNTENGIENVVLFDPNKHISNDIPDAPGNYVVCLKKGLKMPEIGIKCEMKTFQGLQVIYTGIAGKSLRKRDYRQHFTGNNAGDSTLRKSLGSIFGYFKIPRDKDPSTGKTKFKESDEIQLSQWMKSNLVLFFVENPNPGALEDELINDLNPPLNLARNKNFVNREFRGKLSEFRKNNS